MRISTENEGKSQKIGRSQRLIDAITGLMANFLRLIDINAGLRRLAAREGPENFTPKFRQRQRLNRV